MAQKYLLSRLAFECVRDSITLPSNTEFHYENYCSGGYSRTNYDWALQDKKVFPAINLAFARLTQYNKLPLFTKEFSYSDIVLDANDNPYIVVPDDCDSLVNVYTKYSGMTRQFSWREANFDGERRVYISFPVNISSSLVFFVEYRKEIPEFSEDDLVAIEIVDDTTVSDENIDLAIYGVDKRIYQFIKAYVKSEVQEELDPNQANNYKAIAENYFADLETYRPANFPDRIVRAF